jgi:Vanadium chloroperoxidase N-terminal domain/PAP2 superfamily
MSSIRAARQSHARVSDDAGRSRIGEGRAQHAFVAKDADPTMRTDPADRRGAVHDLVKESRVDPILYWNDVALDANKVAHSTDGGEQTGPTLSSRALAIVHLAIHDAYFGVEPSSEHGLYLPDATRLPPGRNAAAAVGAAACAALTALYPGQRPTFEAALAEAGIPEDDAATSRAYGLAVADAIVAKLAIGPGEPGAGAAHYWPAVAKGRHREDPDNPGQGFHAPDYGMTARRIAVTREHELAPPPALTDGEYEEALTEVRMNGGAPGLPTTTRTPEETLVGIYWAYDGAKQIGTPPRLYNAIIRVIAEQKGNGPADNARLFALVNAAMGDAGIFAWKEKYRYDFWRPVLGIREYDPSTGPGAGDGSRLDERGDAFWLPLGSPRTNERRKSFSPNFPAYPSGHATFGAAAFQMARLFYGSPPDQPDDIAFAFVSAELDGKSTDQNGTIRTRHKRRFDSLWHAIFENGLSRVFLGVHWAFDAFAAADVKNPDGTYKDPAQISYDHNVGGVRLGIDIANDIFTSGLACPQQPAPETASARGGRQ